MLDAFKVKFHGKILDYRIGKELDLEKVRVFFESQYGVEKLWSGGRHVLGILKDSKKKLFLKLATTEGISAVTMREYKWNSVYNKASPKNSQFYVPLNYKSGYYNNLFYLITQYFEGDVLCNFHQTRGNGKLLESLSSVIDFSEIVQQLKITDLGFKEFYNNHTDYFVKKTQSWYSGIPTRVRKNLKLSKSLDVVKNGASLLERRPRHGDFTPWHIMLLKNKKFGLIDGEHALSHGVEGYDMCYFIQRVFSVLKNPKIPKEILEILLKRRYDLHKLKVVLAARALGGYLDESLAPKPDYTYANKFKDWVLSL